MVANKTPPQSIETTGGIKLKLLGILLLTSALTIWINNKDGA